ncbi:BbrUII/HgiDII family restriction enzyme [Lonepinella sp. BR2357]|uniref:BbrUII/HgiDII family restriction enzyme n=1 Tax=Lonepinella sp. BR2357 TaxID=3434549 RepID=UPI003F6E2DE1
MAKFHIDLNVLNHLGLSLYSNTPAVLTEIVSNAWDADSTEVHIKIDTTHNDEKIIIEDNGHGMNLADIEQKFLNVGYARRSDGRAITEKKRNAMGRKGIGKLAMFSLADVVDVYTKSNDEDVVALRVDVLELKEAIENKQEYETQNLDDTNTFNLEHGTRIVLSKIHKNIKKTVPYLKKHLARRFSIIGESNNFRVFLNNTEITLADRGYYNKIEFLWSFDEQNNYISDLVDAKHISQLDNFIEYRNERFKVTGFIASVEKPNDLKDGDVSNNAITILANGRIFQENILDELDNAKIFTSYLVGEINADFLDDTRFEDMAISSRQGLRQNDERYTCLKVFLLRALKEIDKDWDTWRRAQGVAEAKKLSPKLNEWLDTLKDSRDKKAAENLIGKINTIRFSGDDESQNSAKKELLKNSILAFEKLKVKGNLIALDKLSAFDIEILKPILLSIDDIEQSYFYDITNQRLEVIAKLKELTSDNEKEKVIQKYLYDHLWLLDPAWERTTRTHMEQLLTDELKKACPDNNNGARIDIAYKNIAGKHIIIEMKREIPSYPIDIYDLIKQGGKYREATKVWYQNNQNITENLGIEVYFLVGTKTKDTIYRKADKDTINDLLKTTHATLLTYDELITQSYNSYAEYLQRKQEVKKLKELIDSI